MMQRGQLLNISSFFNTGITAGPQEAMNSWKFTRVTSNTEYEIEFYVVQIANASDG
jgi:hypothetical protein